MSYSVNHIVIVGAGLAGVTCARELRGRGYDGELTLINDEPVLPYDRPPLSKEYAKGQQQLDDILLEQAQGYEDQKITLLSGVAATAINRQQQTVTLSNATTLPWDKLLLAQGAKPRLLPGLEDFAENTHYIRTLADADKLRKVLTPGRRFVFVGGGVIGMETAASAIESGCSVTVLEALPGIMGRFFPEAIQRYVSNYHKTQGVDVQLGVRISSFVRSRSGAVNVKLEDGREYEADELVIGIGVIPRTELAQQAGLEVDAAIVVNEYGETSAAGIYAAGDNCQFSHPLFGKVRWENWKHAMEQAKVVAANMLGEQTVYSEMPWVWSDQYDLHLQAIGPHDDADQRVLRGDMAADKFTMFHLKNGRVRGVTIINEPRNKKSALQMVAGAMRFTAAALADTGLPLKQLLAE